MDQKFKSRIIGLFFASLVLLGLNFFAGDKIKNYFYAQSLPIQNFIWQLAGAIAFSDRGQVADSRWLVEENQRLSGALAEMNSLKEENIFLRKTLNLKDLEGHNFIDAAVVGGAKFNGVGFDYDDSILITRGKNDGIQKGFSVVTPDKILVGKVAEVYDDYARVLLFTDKNSVVDVQIVKEKKALEKETAGENIEGGQDNPLPEAEAAATEDTYILEKTVAIAKGEGNLKVSLDMFPKDTDLEDGALVVTSSLTGSYPAGFVVGRIKDPKVVDTETFKQAEIIPSFDVRLLNKVLVLRDIEIIKDD